MFEAKSVNGGVGTMQGMQHLFNNCQGHKEGNCKRVTELALVPPFTKSVLKQGSGKCI